MCMSTFLMRYVDKTAMPVMAFRHVRYIEMIRSGHFWSLKQHFKAPECAFFFPLTNPYWRMRRSHSHTLTPAGEGRSQNIPQHITTSNGQNTLLSSLLLRWWGLRMEKGLPGCNLSTNRMTCANTRSFQINTNSRQYHLSLVHHRASGNAGLATLKNTVSIVLFRF